MRPTWLLKEGVYDAEADPLQHSRRKPSSLPASGDRPGSDSGERGE
jgi:hypothetical protein